MGGLVESKVVPESIRTQASMVMPPAKAAVEKAFREFAFIRLPLAKETPPRTSAEPKVNPPVAAPSFEVTLSKKFPSSDHHPTKEPGGGRQSTRNPSPGRWVGKWSFPAATASRISSNARVPAPRRVAF